LAIFAAIRASIRVTLAADARLCRLFARSRGHQLDLRAVSVTVLALSGNEQPQYCHGEQLAHDPRKFFEYRVILAFASTAQKDQHNGRRQNSCSPPLQADGGPKGEPCNGHLARSSLRQAADVF
jgi:hypothetical protein